jgi:hypothetical protein
VTLARVSAGNVTSETSTRVVSGLPLGFVGKSASSHAALWKAELDRVCKSEWHVWIDVIVG